MKSKIFFLSTLLAGSSMCFAGVFTKESLAFELNEGIYVPFNENEYPITPLIQLNRQGYFGKNKDKKTKKKSNEKKHKKDPYYANKHRPPVAQPEESKRQEKETRETSKTEIVAAFDDSEKVWDQDGRELSPEEINQLPKNTQP